MTVTPEIPAQIESIEVPAPESTPVVFPEVTLLKPCTSMECRNGHQWGPQTALAKCGHGTSHGWMGCGEPMLAVKLTACPRCNEPAARMRLRVDLTPPIPFPVPLCIPGSSGNAETVYVDIEWQRSKVTEVEGLVKFRETQDKDNNNG